MKQISERARELIAALDLAAHPEGGYFREVYRSMSSVAPLDGRPQRAALTTIYFLLVVGAVSRWHRVSSDEVWHFLEGDTLQLHVADAAFGRVITSSLGAYGAATAPVHVVPAGCWQAAGSTGAYTLVGCTVGPGFDFADFEMLSDVPGAADPLRLRHPQFIGFV